MPVRVLRCLREDVRGRDEVRFVRRLSRDEYAIMTPPSVAVRYMRIRKHINHTCLNVIGLVISRDSFVMVG